MMTARDRSLWRRLSRGVIGLCTLAALPAGATHLGTIAEVFPIAEDDALTYIASQLNARAASGQLARDQAALRAQVSARALNPAPVAGLRRTTQEVVRYYDPTIRVAADIRDANGALLIARGTRANPFDQLSLSKRVLFFDGRDAAQVAWAARELAQGPALPILVAGEFAPLMRRFGQRVYFDQGGAMVRQLGIEQVPARITQDGKRLRIDEVRP